jgi:hypothetical protein
VRVQVPPSALQTRGNAGFCFKYKNDAMIICFPLEPVIPKQISKICGKTLPWID